MPPSPNSTPAQENGSTAIHHAFSWFPALARHYPEADFVAATHDLAQGIALVLEIVEQSDIARCNEGERPVLTVCDCAILLRHAIAAAHALHTLAWQRIEMIREECE